MVREFLRNTYDEKRMKLINHCRQSGKSQSSHKEDPAHMRANKVPFAKSVDGVVLQKEIDIAMCSLATGCDSLDCNQKVLPGFQVPQPMPPPIRPRMLSHELLAA